MPSKTWVPGESLLATDIQAYLQNQIVSTWATAAARNSGIPIPTVGMMAFVNDIQALQVYLGTAWKTLPHGYLASTQLTADSGTIGATPLPIPGLEVSITVTAGRRVKITSRGNVFCNTINTLIRLYLREGATTLNTTWINSAAGNHANINQQTLLSPSVGSHTYSVYLSVDAGLGNISAAADQPFMLLAEDLGA